MPVRWAMVSLPCCSARSFSYSSVRVTIFCLPLGERLELVAHLGELLHGELLLGVLAGLLDLVLGVFEVGEGLVLLLLGLLALVLVEVLARPWPSGPTARSPARAAASALSFGKPLELLLRAPPGSRLCSLASFLSWSARCLASGFWRASLGLLEVLGLALAELLEVVLGVLQLLDEPGQLALAAVLDRVDQVLEVAGGPAPGPAGPRPSGSFRAGRRPRPSWRRSRCLRLCSAASRSAEAASGSDSSSRLAISSIFSWRSCSPLATLLCRAARLARSAFCSGVSASGVLPISSGLFAAARRPASSPAPAP